MKVVNIFGVVVAVHVVVLVLIFAIPGCRTSSKSPDRQMTSAVEPAPAPTSPAYGTAAPTRDLSADLNPPLAPRNSAGFDTSAVSGGRQSPTRPGSTGGATISPAPLPAAAPELTYTVVRGDSLWAIAKKHGITVAELARANNLRTDASLKLDQTLKIPGRTAEPTAATSSAATVTAPTAARTATPAAAGNGEPTTYEVRPGDTLGAIAKRHQTTVAAIKAFNQRRSDIVRVGEKLQIPAPNATATATATPAAATPPPAPVVAAPAANTARAGGGAMKHVVAPGETLGQVARRYGIDIGVLAEANNIPDPTRIRPGQELILPGVSAPAGTANRTPEPTRYTPSYQPAAGQPATTTPANPPTINTGDSDNVPVIRVEEPEQTLRIEPAPGGGSQPPLFN